MTATAPVMNVVGAFVVQPLIALWDFFYEGWLYIRSLYYSYGLPGPKGLPFLGVVLNFKMHPLSLYYYVLGLFHHYYDFACFYIGPKLLTYLGHPKDLEMVLSSYKFLTKGMFYRFLHPWLGTGLLTSTGDKWRARRKILTPAFHFKILEQFLPVMLSNSDVFVQQLRKRAGGPAFDVFPLCSLLTLDVICETAMGVKVNAQMDSESPYVNAIKNMSHTVMLRGFRPWLYPEFLFWRSKIGQTQAKAIKVLHETTYKVIQERKVELKKLQDGGVKLDYDALGRRRRVAFLDLLLLAGREGGSDAGALSDADIREEVDTFMFEGHDTTASGLAFTLYLLSQHQHVQEKVVQELESMFDASQPLQPSFEDIADMKYLDMVLKESMRLYPPVPVIMRNVANDTPLLSRDCVLPAGSVILQSAYATHRNPHLYPEPEEFNPERFAPDACVERHPFAYLPFSAGPRNCIGQRFAVMELKSAVAKVVWNFRLLPEPGFEPITVWELIMKSTNGVVMKLQERRPRV